MAVFFTQKKDEKIVNYMYMCVLINWARLCDSSMLSAGMYRQYSCRYTISLLKTEITFLYFISYSPYILEVCRRYLSGEALWPIVVSKLTLIIR